MKGQREKKTVNVFREQGGMTLLLRYWRGGALFTTFVAFLLLGTSRTSLELLRLCAGIKTKRKLKKKYRRVIEKVANNYTESPSSSSKRRVWLCWMQGIECAPPVVKACVDSIKECITDREIVVISEKNYRNYVQFPEYVQEKIDAGVIGIAHTTDLLRLELLTKYGGTWIDSTVYCSSKSIPSYMLEDDLFMFQCLKPGRNGHTITISNWFITARANNKLLELTKELLFAYWEKENKLISYFIFHNFFQILIERFPEEWEKVVPFSNSTPHIILLRLFDEYDEKVWNAVKDMTPFHKLSYKFSDNQIGKEGTYYDAIINKGII